MPEKLRLRLNIYQPSALIFIYLLFKMMFKNVFGVEFFQQHLIKYLYAKNAFYNPK